MKLSLDDSLKEIIYFILYEAEMLIFACWSIVFRETKHRKMVPVITKNPKKLPKPPVLLCRSVQCWVIETKLQTR